MFRSFFNVKQESTCTALATADEPQIRGHHIEISRSTQNFWNRMAAHDGTWNSYKYCGKLPQSWGFHLSSSFWFFPSIHYHENFCYRLWPFGLCHFRYWSLHVSRHVGQWVWLPFPSFCYHIPLRSSRSSLLTDVPIALTNQIPARECRPVTVLSQVSPPTI
jgi:hypothetical protein